MSDTPVPSAVAGDPARLRQFVQWLAAVAFAFASAGAVAYLDQNDPAIAAIALVNAGFGCCLLLIGNLGVGARIGAAAALGVALAFLVTALAISVALPTGVTALGVLPMLAVAVALRSPDERVLLRLLVVAGAAGLLLGIVVEVVQRQSVQSDLGLGLLRVGGQAMAVVLVIYALWQFTGQLRRSLDRVSETNAALQEATGSLTSVNDTLRRNVAELESRNREMTRLVELGELLSSSQTSAEVAAVISRVVPPLFAGDAGAFYELASGSVAVEAVALWGDPPPARRVFSPTECWALRRGRVHVMDGSASQLRCPHIEEPTPEGAVCAPLAAEGESLGVLHLQVRQLVPGRRRTAVLADRERLTRTLAEQLELALANFRLRETLREQSARDQLTGLFNRRYMEESLDRELRRASREGYSLGLLMMDLDHFKDLNDGFGHAAGDLMLRAVGEFLGSSVRGDDVACRFGGEEFVVILPRASLENTRRRAETLREGMKGLTLEVSGPLRAALTISIGVACSPDHGETREQLVHAADVALYRAKAAGRDRVLVASDGGVREVEVFAQAEEASGPSTSREGPPA
ncbi:MAG TPA: diguanylate cyclase [Candidatus Limnocylindria bacterium]|nr:diguanylate cyclase [Candidatus Limnocylindria bacterium]